MTHKDAEALTLHRLALARAAVLEKAEYYASTLLNMTPVVVDRGTMGVTKHLVLYVNPEWFLRSGDVGTDDKSAGLLAHECEHPLRGIDRIEALPNKEIANYAADASINWNLREEGWMLPDGGVYPETYGLPGGKTLEWYYEKLVEMCDQQQQAISQLTQSMKAQAGSSGGKSKGKGKSKDGGDGSADGSGGSGGSDEGWSPGIAAGACGGVAGNALDPSLEAELDKEYGKSEAEVEAIRRQTLEAIEQHIQQYGRGSVPGRFSELIKTKIRAPEVNWRKKLRQVFRRTVSLAQAGGRDYSISRPSMSSIATGALFSGLVDHPVIVAVVQDTSMSMGTPQLVSAHNESFHIAKRSTTGRIWLIQADVDVTRCELVRPTQIPKLDFKGRGGTDFRRVFTKLVKLRPRPNVVVYITDGDGVAPRRPPPGMEVIWCIVRTPHARRPAYWGHLVVCDKNQALADPVVLDD